MTFACFILSQMRHRDFAEPLRIAGANQIISTVELAVSTMVNAIEYPQVKSMMHFVQGQIEVLKLSLPQSCYAVGLSVTEIAQDSRFPLAPSLLAINPTPIEI